MSEDSENIAPEDEERAYFNTRLQSLRTEHEDMLFVSFPGDKKSSGGCVLFEQKRQVEAILNQEAIKYE